MILWSRDELNFVYFYLFFPENTPIRSKRKDSLFYVLPDESIPSIKFAAGISSIEFISWFEYLEEYEEPYMSIVKMYRNYLKFGTNEKGTYFTLGYFESYEKAKYIQ